MNTPHITHNNIDADTMIAEIEEHGSCEAGKLYGMAGTETREKLLRECEQDLIRFLGRDVRCYYNGDVVWVA